MKLAKSRRLHTDDTLIILALVRSLILSSYCILNGGHLATRYHTISLSDYAMFEWLRPTAQHFKFDRRGQFPKSRPQSFYE